METRSIYLLESSGSNNLLLRDTLDRLFRQKNLVAMLFLLWTAGIGAYVWLSPPVYQEDIQFLINNNRAGTVISPEYNNGPVSRDYVDETVIATEIQLLSNTDLLHSVVEKSGLADASDQRKVEKAVIELQKKLKISPVLKANMVKATYSSPYPEEVEAVLKNLSDGYLEEHLRTRGNKGAFELFDQQAKFYQNRLRELQDRLTNFQQPRNIVALAQQKDLNLHKLLDLEAGLKDNQAARLANTQKMVRLQDELAHLKPRITTQSRKVPNQYSAEQLNTMLAQLENKRTDLLSKFQPQDRLVQEVEKEIADTKAALDRSNEMASTEETTDVNPLRQSLEEELAKAQVSDAEFRSRSASMEQEIADYRGSLSSLENATADDNQLLRDLKEAEDNFYLYSKKREEARIEEAMDQDKIANAVLVKPARLPVLPLPRISITIAATYALGCLLILGLAFGVGIVRPAVYTPWELEGITGIPVLASVPRVPLPGRTSALLSGSVPEL